MTVRLRFRHVLPIAAALVVGCGPSTPQMPVGAASGSGPSAGSTSKVVVPHPVTEDKEYLADQAKKKTVKPPVPEKPLDKSIDRDVAGEYRLALTNEQVTTMNKSLDEMRRRAMAGDKGAEANYNMAKATLDLAMRMVVTLKPDGTYSADFGSGATMGTFKTGKGVVVMTPDVPPDDPSLPKDVELKFDKARKNLIVDYLGKTMVLERQR